MSGFVCLENRNQVLRTRFRNNVRTFWNNFGPFNFRKPKKLDFFGTVPLIFVHPRTKINGRRKFMGMRDAYTIVKKVITSRTLKNIPPVEQKYVEVWIYWPFLKNQEISWYKFHIWSVCRISWGGGGWGLVSACARKFWNSFVTLLKLFFGNLSPVSNYPRLPIRQTTILGDNIWRISKIPLNSLKCMDISTKWILHGHIVVWPTVDECKCATSFAT